MASPQKASSQASEAPSPEDMAKPMPDMNFKPAKDVRAPDPARIAARAELSPEEEEGKVQQRILNAIEARDDEPGIDVVGRISATCVVFQEADYNRRIKPVVQAGLDLVLDHWAGIHLRLEKGEPVEVKEACRTAEAIAEILGQAPYYRWPMTRAINEDRLMALQMTEETMIESQHLRETCLRNTDMIIAETESEKDLLKPDNHRMALKETARMLSQELLDNPRIKATPPGKTELLSPNTLNQAGASR